MAPQTPASVETMKAMTYHRYGSPDVLSLEDVRKPVPRDGQVLVRVRAASVNPLDWHLLRGHPYFARADAGWRTPKRTVPGVDLAGRVEAVGRNVTRFKPGDEVFGEKSRACAEYVCAPENMLVPKPASLTFEEAAAIPAAGVTALQALRDKGGVRPGQRVLINGASGGVGTFAVQIAKADGADVTGVCSTPNLELVRSIGADHVIDYTQNDFTRTGQTYDLIIDNVGNRSLRDLRRILTPGGTLVIIGAPKGRLILGFVARLIAAPVLSRFSDQRLLGHLTETRLEDLVAMSELVEAGKVRSIIDRCYPLSETPDAIRYLETLRARGKVVITV